MRTLLNLLKLEPVVGFEPTQSHGLAGDSSAHSQGDSQGSPEFKGPRDMVLLRLIEHWPNLAPHYKETIRGILAAATAKGGGA